MALCLNRSLSANFSLTYRITYWHSQSTITGFNSSVHLNSLQDKSWKDLLSACIKAPSMAFLSNSPNTGFTTRENRSKISIGSCMAVLINFLLKGSKRRPTCDASWWSIILLRCIMDRSIYQANRQRNFEHRQLNQWIEIENKETKQFNC